MRFVSRLQKCREVLKRTALTNDQCEHFVKHEPREKFSARSVDNMNMSGLPTKTRDNKNHASRISDTPIRIGKQFAA